MTKKTVAEYSSGGVSLCEVDGPIILTYNLIKTTRRLTFDIIYQHPSCTYQGADDGEYWHFTASNGYEIISRSRMDIQTERIWLKGGTNDERSIRSGTMTFATDESRDEACAEFHKALAEWAEYIAKKLDK